MSDVSALDAQPTAGKQAVFSPPNDASMAVQARIADLSKQAQTAQGQKDLRGLINQHYTQIYSYDGRVAVSLKVPGFLDSSAEGSSQCMIYEQSHYWTEPYDDYEYDIGWTQRLVIKVTKWDAKVSLTVPTYVAASCEVGSSTAQVQYVIRGLSGPYKNLTGDAKTFNVDQYAQYAVKMQGLLDDVDNLEMNIEPLVIARVLKQDAPQTSRRDLYRGYAYRLSGVSGILRGKTADDWFQYVTTKGKDESGKFQPIADTNYLRECIDAAYADYAIAKGKTISDGKSQPDQEALINQIKGDLDGFAIGRQAFE
jgi:hypothetical protein